MSGRNRRRLQKHLRREAAAHPTPTMTQIVWYAAWWLWTGDLGAVELAGRLDRMPVEFGDEVRRQATQRDRMRASGWTDATLADVEDALVDPPAGANDLERDLRLLALLGALRPPAVAA